MSNYIPILPDVNERYMVRSASENDLEALAEINLNIFPEDNVTQDFSESWMEFNIRNSYVSDTRRGIVAQSKRRGYFYVLEQKPWMEKFKESNVEVFGKASNDKSGKIVGYVIYEHKGGFRPIAPTIELSQFAAMPADHTIRSFLIDESYFMIDTAVIKRFGNPINILTITDVPEMQRLYIDRFVGTKYANNYLSGIETLSQIKGLYYGKLDRMDQVTITMERWAIEKRRKELAEACKWVKPLFDVSESYTD
jgi:hypothetical protein